MTLTNPAGAFGQPATSGPTGQVLREYIASAEITAGQIVKIVNTGGVVSVAPTADGDHGIGVARDSVLSGRSVQVIIAGPAFVSASGASIGANTYFAGGANGQVAAAGAAGTTAVGRMLEASGTTAGALKLAYIQPSIKA